MFRQKWNLNKEIKRSNLCLPSVISHCSVSQSQGDLRGVISPSGGVVEQGRGVKEAKE